MSRSLNSVTLLGRLTRDPEIRATSTGQTVCRFGLALNRVYFNRDTQEKIEKVTFVDITAWGNLAENVSQYCTKGKQILVQGRLESSSWEAGWSNPKQAGGCCPGCYFHSGQRSQRLQRRAQQLQRRSG